MRISQTVTKLWGLQELLGKEKNQKGHNLKSNKRGKNDACAQKIIFTWYIILLNFMTISKNVTELWGVKE